MVVSSDVQSRPRPLPRSLRFTYSAFGARVIFHKLGVVAYIYVPIVHHDEAASLGAGAVSPHNKVAK